MTTLPSEIFQAPIGSVTCPALASAVSEAGGIGHLACTWRDPVLLREDLIQTRALTSRAFGANFVLDFPIDVRLSIVLEHRVPIVSFFWGDGSRYLDRIKASGALAIQVVGSVDEARTAVDAGFDIVVAQGIEAGGHVRGHLPLNALLPRVLDVARETPVLAAGGIGDRTCVESAMALGARGVWVGTAFLAATEANIHPRYRDLVLAADRTEYSRLYDIGWPNAPMRTLPNSTHRRWQDHGCRASGRRPGEGEVVAVRSDGSPIPRYHFSAPVPGTVGAIEAMALYAGTGVWRVRRAESAAAIVGRLLGNTVDSMP